MEYSTALKRNRNVLTTLHHTCTYSEGRARCPQQCLGWWREFFLKCTNWQETRQAAGLAGSPPLVEATHRLWLLGVTVCCVHLVNCLCSLLGQARWIWQNWGGFTEIPEGVQHHCEKEQEKPLVWLRTDPCRCCKAVTQENYGNISAKPAHLHTQQETEMCKNCAQGTRNGDPGLLTRHLFLLQRRVPLGNFNCKCKYLLNCKGERIKQSCPNRKSFESWTQISEVFLHNEVNHTGKLTPARVDYLKFKCSLRLFKFWYLYSAISFFSIQF